MCEISVRILTRFSSSINGGSEGCRLFKALRRLSFVKFQDQVWNFGTTLFASLRWRELAKREICNSGVYTHIIDN
ncbi:hypothetical protein MKW98_031984, partial [Papaver atlanticum]